MNKFITKIATAMVGIAMAVGVGVAVGSKASAPREARATDVTFDATEDMSSTLSIAKSGITLEIDGTGTLNNGSNYRVYASTSNTLTITSSVGNITQIILNCNATGTSKGGPGTLSGTGYSYSSKVGTWQGNASSVTLTNTGTQTQINSAVITYTPSGNLVSLSANSHGTLSGDVSIPTGNSGTVTITPDTGYKLPGSVTVTNATLTSYNSTTGVVQLSNVQGAVTINATCPPLEDFAITISKSNCTCSGDTTIKEKTGTATITFVPDTGYGLPDDVTVTGATKSWTKATGVLVLTVATAAPTVTISCPEITLSSIAVTGGTRSFYYGHDFEHTSAVVMATYSDSSQKDVTASATFSEPNMFTTGNQTITVSYSEKGVDKSTSYTITVNDKVEKGAGWERVTNESTLLAGGKFIFGYEATEDSGVIVPMRNYGTMTTSAAGIIYSGIKPDGTDGATTTTIDMSSVSNTSNYEVTVSNVSATQIAISMKDGYLLAVDDNKAKLSTTIQTLSELTVEINNNDSFNLTTVTGSNTRYLRYNTASSQQRFVFYKSGTGVGPVAYKYNQAVVKELVKIEATFAGTKYAGDSISESELTPFKTYDTGASSRVQITSASELANFSITSSKTLVYGDNTVEFSYTESGVTKHGSLVINAGERTAELTGLTWDQGAYSVIDGTGIDFSRFGTVTAIYDSGASSATKSISSCSVALYSKSGDVYTKEADLTDGDTITSEDHDGFYLGVSYTEVSTTVKAYSSAPLDIVEHLESIRAKEEVWSYSKTTSISVGDRIAIVNEQYTVEPLALSTNYLTEQSYSTAPSGVLYFMVESDGEGNYALHNPTGGYLQCNSSGSSGNNYIYLVESKDTTDYKTSWTITFDGDGNAVITNVWNNQRTVRYNHGNTRFSCYGSGMLDIQLYKGQKSYSPTGPDYANTNVAVQKAVLNFVETMMSNAYLGSCSNSSSFDTTKWSGLKSAFASADKGGDATLFVNMFKYATAAERNAEGLTPTGDTLQKALARYDLVIYRYNTSLGSDYDFLGRIEAGTASGSGAVRISPLPFSLNDSSTITAVVIISVIGVASVGAFFLLRKKKED